MPSNPAADCYSTFTMLCDFACIPIVWVSFCYYQGSRDQITGSNTLSLSSLLLTYNVELERCFALQ